MIPLSVYPIVTDFVFLRSDFRLHDIPSEDGVRGKEEEKEVTEL